MTDLERIETIVRGAKHVFKKTGHAGGKKLMDDVIWMATELRDLKQALNIKITVQFVTEPGIEGECLSIDSPATSDTFTIPMPDGEAAKIARRVNGSWWHDAFIQERPFPEPWAYAVPARPGAHVDHWVYATLEDAEEQLKYQDSVAEEGETVPTEAIPLFPGKA
jgi:hypothetical protein